jgi:hypothetical protein
MNRTKTSCQKEDAEKEEEPRDTIRVRISKVERDAEAKLLAREDPVEKVEEEEEVHLVWEVHSQWEMHYPNLGISNLKVINNDFFERRKARTTYL